VSHHQPPKVYDFAEREKTKLRLKAKVPLPSGEVFCAVVRVASDDPRTMHKVVLSHHQPPKVTDFAERGAADRKPAIFLVCPKINTTVGILF